MPNGIISAVILWMTDILGNCQGKTRPLCQTLFVTKYDIYYTETQMLSWFLRKKKVIKKFLLNFPWMFLTNVCFDTTGYT